MAVEESGGGPVSPPPAFRARRCWMQLGLHRGAAKAAAAAAAKDG